MSSSSGGVAQPNAVMCSSETIGSCERIVLVAELDDRARQLGALLEPEALDQRAGRDVADDDLERDDLDFLDQLLAHVDAADEVGRDAEAVQLGEDELGNAVVEHALAVDDLVLGAVAGGGVVLEVLDQRAGLGTLVEDLGLALIDFPAAVHLCHVLVNVGRIGRVHAPEGPRNASSFMPRAPSGRSHMRRFPRVPARPSNCRSARPLICLAEPPISSGARALLRRSRDNVGIRRSQEGGRKRGSPTTAS